MKYSSDKDIDALVKQLTRGGWDFRRGRKHGLLRAPVGALVLSVPSSPSDRRAYVNFRQDVRRALRHLL